jgi:hypothetical protein
MLILLGKVLVGAIPGMTQDLSWTVTNLGYMAVCPPSPADRVVLICRYLS